MKKTVTRKIEVNICDNCSGEHQMTYICFACGYCSCWTCSEKVMVKFSFGVHISGWADGYYCKSCDIKLSESKSDPLHNAYMDVRRIRDEEKQWYAAFDNRKKAAEAETERLFNAFRAKQKG